MKRLKRKIAVYYLFTFKFIAKTLKVGHGHGNGLAV